MSRRPRKEVLPGALEPRLLHRRLQVADEVRRARFLLLKLFGLVVTVGLLIVGILFSPLFDIDKVAVKGGAHLSTQEVETISGLQHGTALVVADLDSATERLKSDPWISYAKVRRSYPGTVLVDITEEKPVLVLRTPSGSAIVSKNGRIIEFLSGSGSQEDPPSAGDQALVIAAFDGRIVEGGSENGSPFVGRRVSQPVQDLVRLASHLTPLVSERLSELQGGHGSDITLMLDDGSVVVFGPVEDVAAKLSAVQAVLEQVDLECLAEIDVRNPIRATVTRAEGCSIPTE